MGNKPAKPLSSLEIQLNECMTYQQDEVDLKVVAQKCTEICKKWESAFTDIALLGASGVGKSSLINNLLDVPTKSEEEIAEIRKEIAMCDHSDRTTCKHTYAPTDSNECTSAATPYTFIETSRVRLWDLPGYGAKFYRDAETYWKQLEVDKYGAFLCLFRDNRDREGDEQVVKYLLERGKQVIWVRTFFDAAMRGKKTAQEQASEKEKARVYLVRREVVDPVVYCVSGLYDPGDESTNKYKYDLDDLKAAIITALPDENKIHFTHHFRGFNESLILVKFDFLKKWIALSCIFPAISATISPFIGPILTACSEFAHAEDSINALASVYGFTSEGTLLYANFSEQQRQEIEEKIGKQLVPTLRDLLARLKTCVGVSATVSVVIGWVPIVGQIATASSIGGTRSFFLKKVNRVCRNAALDVVKLINQQA